MAHAAIPSRRWLMISVCAIQVAICSKSWYFVLATWMILINLSYRNKNDVFDCFSRYFKVICLFQQYLYPGWAYAICTQRSHLFHLFSDRSIWLISIANLSLLSNCWAIRLDLSSPFIRYFSIAFPGSCMLSSCSPILLTCSGIIVHLLCMSILEQNHRALIILWTWEQTQDSFANHIEYLCHWQLAGEIQGGVVE